MSALAKWAQRGRRAATAFGIVTAVALALAPVAVAWRHPTRTERQAITRVARRRSVAPPGGTVHVSRIRVSTAGPWAAATITLVVGGVGDAATDILHRVHGRWTNASVGTAGEECVMPPVDRRNLGLAGYPCHR